MTPSAIVAPVPTASGYRRFPNVARRNFMHGVIEVPLIVRLFGLPREVSMLEVGCGRGVGLSALARLLSPRRLVGVDVDACLLALARSYLASRGNSAELHHADVRALPFGDGTFDVVIDFGTLYHISRSEAALGEIERVLVAGGLFIYETKINQLLGHPVRSKHRWIPWNATTNGGMLPLRQALLWGMRVKRS